MGVLLGFNIEPRTEEILSSFCRSQKNEYRPVMPQDQWKKLAALSGMMQETDKPGFAVPFTQPMLVMCLYSQEHMDALLKVLRAQGISIPLKAVMTPTNARWSALQLQKELQREYEAVLAQRKKEQEG